MVQSYGFKYKTSALSDLLALDTGAVADVRLGYKLPLLSDRQYLALKPTGDVTIGSKVWLAFTFFFVKAKVTLEGQVAKLEPYIKLMVDSIRYSDVCLDLGVMASALELNLYTQIDIMDCNAGLAGGINQLIDLIAQKPSKYGELKACEWKNYVFEEPALCLNLGSLGLSRLKFDGHLDQAICANPPTSY